MQNLSNFRADWGLCLRSDADLRGAVFGAAHSNKGMPRHERLEKQKSTILKGAPKYTGGASLPFAWSTAFFAILSIDGIYLSRVQSCVAVAIWVFIMRWLLCSYLS